MDSKLLDLTGQKFGTLVAMERANIVGYPEFDGWNCKCMACGRSCNVPTNELLDGKFKSCGCKHDSWKLAGRRFGRLLVLRRVGIYKNANTVCWECRCDCGKITYVAASNLVKPNGTKSCGCLIIDAVKRANTKWTKTEKKLLRVYRHMLYRCYSKKCKFYKGYGGRGIKVCKEWIDSELEFIDWSIHNGYEPGKRLSLDRINNDKGYSPDNCRWASSYTQSNNRRTSHYLTICGYTHSVTEWCHLAGLPDTTVFSKKTDAKMKKRILQGFADNHIPFDVAKLEYFEKPIISK